MGLAPCIDQAPGLPGRDAYDQSARCRREPDAAPCTSALTRSKQRSYHLAELERRRQTVAAMMHKAAESKVPVLIIHPGTGKAVRCMAWEPSDRRTGGRPHEWAGPCPWEMSTGMQNRHPRFTASCTLPRPPAPDGDAVVAYTSGYTPHDKR